MYVIVHPVGVVRGVLGVHAYAEDQHVPLMDKLLGDADVPVDPADAAGQNLESEVLDLVGQRHLLLDGGLVPSLEDGPPVDVPVVEGRKVQGPVPSGPVAQCCLEDDAAHAAVLLGERRAEAKGADVVGEVALSRQRVDEEVGLRSMRARLGPAGVDEEGQAKEEEREWRGAGQEHASSSPLPVPLPSAASLGQLLLRQAALQQALRVDGDHLGHGEKSPLVSFCSRGVHSFRRMP